MSLDKELEGVTKPDIASPDDVIAEEPTLGGTSEIEQVASEPEAEEPEAKSGRTAENVYRELSRKQEDFQNGISQQIAQVLDLVKVALGSDQRKKPEERTLDDYSMEELRALSAKVPDENKAQFQEYYQQRLIDDAVNKKVTKVTEDQKYARERAIANQRAVDTYPQLLEKTSPLAMEVNRRLADMDPNYRKYNPRIVLHLTQEVATELGVKPVQVAAPSARSFLAPSSARSSKPVPANESNEPSTVSDEEYEKIASRLQHMLPKGKKFDKKKIVARGREYHNYLSRKDG